MKQLVGVIVLIIVIVSSVVMYSKTGDKVAGEVRTKTYESIINEDLEYNYPKTTIEVVKLYTKIEQLLYSGYIGSKDGADKVNELIKIQLQLCDDEFIEYNGGEELIALNATDEIHKFNDLGYSIVNVKLQTNTNVADDGKGNVLKFVNVIEYINRGENSYKVYALRKDSAGRWKILTYQETEKFSITEKVNATEKVDTPSGNIIKKRLGIK